MKKITFLLLILVLMVSCKEELVKWEFSSTPSIKEVGPVTSNGINIHKDVAKSDVTAKLGLESTAELKTLEILGATVSISIDPNTVQAESLKFQLFCDAIPAPLGPAYQSTIAIPKGKTTADIKDYSLLSNSIAVIDYLNHVLKDLIDGKTSNVKFSLVGNNLPSGSSITGTVDLHIDFHATYWDCIEKPEYTVFNDLNKGPCE